MREPRRAMMTAVRPIGGIGRRDLSQIDIGNRRDQEILSVMPIVREGIRLNAPSPVPGA